jgi:hypothetical protein
MANTTDFDTILNKFYDRIEKDENFFNYYHVSITEAKAIATQRATNYLIESLDDLSMIGGLQVNFADYDEEVRLINFKLLPKEIRLIVEMMFLKYMKRDEALLHAMEINFTPSDLTVFSPANERTSYRNFIQQLSDKVDIKIDDYKNRDRTTNALKQTIDYSVYSED